MTRTPAKRGAAAARRALREPPEPVEQLRTATPPPDGRCRVCGAASWHTDDEGPVHVCCAREGSPCPACIASVAQERKWQDSGRQWAARVKAHHDAENARRNAKEGQT